MMPLDHIDLTGQSCALAKVNNVSFVYDY